MSCLCPCLVEFCEQSLDLRQSRRIDSVNSSISDPAGRMPSSSSKRVYYPFGVEFIDQGFQVNFVRIARFGPWHALPDHPFEGNAGKYGREFEIDRQEGVGELRVRVSAKKVGR